MAFDHYTSLQALKGTFPFPILLPQGNLQVLSIKGLEVLDFQCAEVAYSQILYRTLAVEFRDVSACFLGRSLKVHQPL